MAQSANGELDNVNGCVAIKCDRVLRKPIFSRAASDREVQRGDARHESKIPARATPKFMERSGMRHPSDGIDGGETVEQGERGMRNPERDIEDAEPRVEVTSIEFSPLTSCKPSRQRKGAQHVPASNREHDTNLRIIRWEHRR